MSAFLKSAVLASSSLAPTVVRCAASFETSGPTVVPADVPNFPTRYASDQRGSLDHQIQLVS